MDNSILSRCQLFEQIAQQTWIEVLEQRNNGIEPGETGITKRIIARIRAASTSDSKIGLWSNPGHREAAYGSDMDLFVESGNGRYVWFAMQAKALRLDETYGNLRKTSRSEFQWEKLQRLQSNSNCLPLYLFYNGVDVQQTAALVDACHRPFSADQYGCSVVTLKNLIEKGSILNPVGQNYIHPTFFNFHPRFAQPWRVLTCCSFTRNATYTISQIKEYVRYYDKLGDMEIAELVEEESGFLNADGQGDGPIDKRLIVKSAKESNYTSKYVMLIQSSQMN